MVIYFILAILWSLTFENIAMYVKIDLSFNEKILNLILWPIMLIIFLDGFFKCINKN
jgi:hypothetical protein